jgi:hypothetical protein
MFDRWTTRKSIWTKMVYPTLVLDLLHRRHHSNGRAKWRVGWYRHGQMGGRPGSWSSFSSCPIVHVGNVARPSSRSCCLVCSFILSYNSDLTFISQMLPTLHYTWYLRCGLYQLWNRKTNGHRLIQNSNGHRFYMGFDSRSWYHAAA